MYRTVPNELKEDIFLYSIETLQDLQQQCKLNKQHKLYCDKHFTSQITPIMEAIRNVINETGKYPTYTRNEHVVNIFTNKKDTPHPIITTEGSLNTGIYTSIYTKFNHNRVLIDILNSIKTQSRFNYDILHTSRIRHMKQFVIYSSNQRNIPELIRDYIRISII